MPAKLIVYLVRHEETVMNSKHIIQGQKDIPLGQIGENQAKLLGWKLLNQNVKFTVAYSSDLQRAIKTASIIVQEMRDKLEVESDKILRERSLGVLEGIEISKAYLLAADQGVTFYEYNPKGGESQEEFSKRINKFLEILCKRADGIMEDENILVVSHAVWIISLMRQLFEKKSFYRLENGEFNEVECSKSPQNTGFHIIKIYPANGDNLRVISLEKINDSSHLI